jgi:hypothetical protein
LARFFRACGFAPEKLILEYDKQYLTIEGSFKDSTLNTFDIEESIEQTVDEALTFSNTVKKQIDAWQKKLERLSAKDAQIAIWGSGSKCVAFLFSLGMADKIDRIIDINPHRHGKYAPGLRTKIEGPQSLRDTNLDLLIIMNPIYQAEIEADLARLNCSVSSIEALG